MITTAQAARAPVVIAVCWFITALEGYDVQVFGVVAPQMVHALALNGGQQGWTATAAMIGVVLGASAGGWLADILGRRPVLLASVAGFGVCSLWTALSHDFTPLVCARFATGVGLGGALPNLIAIAGDISPPRRRAATISAIFCGLPAGGAAAALLAKGLGGAFDWRVLFAIGGALPLLLVPLISSVIPGTRPRPTPEAVHSVSTALFGRGRLAYTLCLWVGNLLTILCLYLMLNWLPSLVVAKGFTAGDGATAALVFNLAGIGGALVLGWWVDGVGYRWGLSLIYGSLAVVMYALSVDCPLRVTVVLSGAAGFLILGAQFALYGITSLLYPAPIRAAGAGAAVAVGRLGSIIGPLMAGQMRMAGWPSSQVLSSLLPVVVAAGSAAFALSFADHRQPHRGAAPLDVRKSNA